MSERLQNKMYDYEVTPPANLWEKIAAALDESEMSHEFPSKLYEIEITPPANTWNKIKTSLDTEEPELSEHKKVIPFFRYAVAAAIIGLVVLGSIQLIKSKSADNKIVQQKEKLTGKDTTTPPAKAGENTAVTDEKNDDIALEDSKQTLAKLDIPVGKKIKNVSKNYFIRHVLDNGGSDNDNGYAEAAYKETSNNIAGRYIAVMTPDCNVVRVSKKLDHLVCCVAGDDPGTVCKDQLQKWREKIACSSMAASPGNFMDIVSLVNSLQEDND
jgi:hypothetical protein